MKPSILFAALSASVLLCTAGLSAAADNPAAAAKTPAPQADPRPEGKAKKVVTIKTVDINGATKKELKTLPGIGDAEADKIIAGRPYGSKAWLVTRNVIPAATYEELKTRIMAKQQCDASNRCQTPQPKQAEQASPEKSK